MEFGNNWNNYENNFGTRANSPALGSHLQPAIIPQTVLPFTDNPILL